MFALLCLSFVAFPSRNDALLSTNNGHVKTDVSGSLGLYYNGKCHQTYGNSTLDDNSKIDWCSNIVPKDVGSPFITYYIPNKAFKLTGYSIRNGCCYYTCCCDPETGKDIFYDCCCRLYSFSLQGSNDNKTWKVIHKVENDAFIDYCEYKTYSFQQTESFNYVRLNMDEELPGCPRCMQINQIEFYGETVSSLFLQYPNDSIEDDLEESVSIIGKVKKY